LFFSFSSEKEKNGSYCLSMDEEAALRILLQTSPTCVRGLWWGVFFSIELNPSTDVVGVYRLVIVSVLEIPIDSGMGFSITINKLRVFINKTLSTQSLINQLLIKRVDLSCPEWLVVAPVSEVQYGSVMF
jgi:hypothetical protein